MKVKVVCACAVSLGCQFFHQQGEKVDFPLRRNALFGKSRLVPFNEVSKGPDHFSPLTSGLFLFCTFVKEVKTQTSPLRGGDIERHVYCSLLFTICLHYIFMW